MSSALTRQLGRGETRQHTTAHRVGYHDHTHARRSAEKTATGLLDYGAVAADGHHVSTDSKSAALEDELRRAGVDTKTVGKTGLARLVELRARLRAHRARAATRSLRPDGAARLSMFSAFNARRSEEAARVAAWDDVVAAGSGVAFPPLAMTNGKRASVPAHGSGASASASTAAAAAPSSPPQPSSSGPVEPPSGLYDGWFNLEHSLAAYYINRGELASAVQLYDKLLGIESRKHGGNYQHGSTATLHAGKGAAQLLAGGWAGAELSYTSAAAASSTAARRACTCGGAGSHDHPHSLGIAAAVGVSRAQQGAGRYADAVATLLAALNDDAALPTASSSARSFSSGPPSGSDRYARPLPAWTSVKPSPASRHSVSSEGAYEGRDEATGPPMPGAATHVDVVTLWDRLDAVVAAQERDEMAAEDVPVTVSRFEELDRAWATWLSELARTAAATSDFTHTHSGWGGGGEEEGGDDGDAEAASDSGTFPRLGPTLVGGEADYTAREMEPLLRLVRHRRGRMHTARWPARPQQLDIAPQAGGVGATMQPAAAPALGLVGAPAPSAEVAAGASIVAAGASGRGSSFFGLINSSSGSPDIDGGDVSENIDADNADGHDQRMRMDSECNDSTAAHSVAMSDSVHTTAEHHNSSGDADVLVTQGAIFHSPSRYRQLCRAAESARAQYWGHMVQPGGPAYLSASQLAGDTAGEEEGVVGDHLQAASHPATPTPRNHHTRNPASPTPFPLRHPLPPSSGWIRPTYVELDALMSQRRWTRILRQWAIAASRPSTRPNTDTAAAAVITAAPTADAGAGVAADTAAGARRRLTPPPTGGVLTVYQIDFLRGLMRYKAAVRGRDDAEAAAAAEEDASLVGRDSSGDVASGRSRDGEEWGWRATAGGAQGMLHAITSPAEAAALALSIGRSLLARFVTNTATLPFLPRGLRDGVRAAFARAADAHAFDGVGVLTRGVLVYDALPAFLASSTGARYERERRLALHEPTWPLAHVRVMCTRHSEACAVAVQAVTRSHLARRRLAREAQTAADAVEAAQAVAAAAATAADTASSSTSGKVDGRPGQGAAGTTSTAAAEAAVKERLGKHFRFAPAATAATEEGGSRSGGGGTDRKSDAPPRLSLPHTDATANTTTTTTSTGPTIPAVALGVRRGSIFRAVEAADAAAAAAASAAAAVTARASARAHVADDESIDFFEGLPISAYGHVIPTTVDPSAGLGLISAAAAAGVGGGGGGRGVGTTCNPFALRETPAAIAERQAEERRCAALDRVTWPLPARTAWAIDTLQRVARGHAARRRVAALLEPFVAPVWAAEAGCWYYLDTRPLDGAGAAGGVARSSWTPPFPLQAASVRYKVLCAACSGALAELHCVDCAEALCGPCSSRVHGGMGAAGGARGGDTVDGADASGEIAEDQQAMAHHATFPVSVDTTPVCAACASRVGVKRCGACAAEEQGAVAAAAAYEVGIGRDDAGPSGVVARGGGIAGEEGGGNGRDVSSGGRVAVGPTGALLQVEGGSRRSGSIGSLHGQSGDVGGKGRGTAAALAALPAGAGWVCLQCWAGVHAAHPNGRAAMRHDDDAETLPLFARAAKTY